MLLPLSWLKEYVPVTLPFTKFIERLHEIGIGVEAVHKKEEDTVLELEITPNRPDLLSILGVAREVAAMQSSNRILTVKIPKSSVPKPKKKLPITIKPDYELSPRLSGIIIDGIQVKESPLWMQERLTKAGQRSINNIVDITNYVMLELGNPIHAFDYDKIEGHTMTVTKAGGDAFTSVDNISYKLPKNAMIIKDAKRIIDLCGIKGGANSGIKHETKRVFLLFPVFDGKSIRKTSQALSLRSEASSIFERGVNKGGTLEALARATDLILELAGGKVASEVMDIKKQQFLPWKLQLSLSRLTHVLGIDLDEKRVMKILTALNLSPQKAGDTITVTIPTYRNDLQIEEDLIEEVARMYGYNKFPKTLPKGEIPTTPIPYESGFEQELAVKNLMTSFGFSEANTYSLVSKEDVELLGGPVANIISLTNPVSREFSILRPSLLINLIKAIPLNVKHREHIFLFELGKVYTKEGSQPIEKRSLSAIGFPATYFDIKGGLERLLERLSIPITFESVNESLFYNRKKAAKIVSGKTVLGTIGEVKKMEEVSCFEVDFDLIISLMPKTKLFQPVPKYPPLIEDLSLIASRDIPTGKLMEEIKMVSKLVGKVEFLDIFEDTRSFRITYQDPEKNLSSNEVAVIRRQILSHLKKFSVTIKA